MSTPAGTLREHRHKIASKRPREAAPASLRDQQPLAPGAILQRAALAPESLRPADLLRLQQTVGNRATGGLLNRPSGPRPVIQAKLSVNAPGDEYEQEADRVADAVMRMPAVQREDLDEDEQPDVMTKREQVDVADGAFEAGEHLEQQLRASQGWGHPLPPNLREEFEAKFGADFSGVRIHTDVRSAEMNQEIKARAFTHGQDIYLGPNHPNLHSAQAKPLLAHELTHVLQQHGQRPIQNRPVTLRSRVLTPSDVVQLQRSVGNQVVRQPLREASQSHHQPGPDRPVVQCQIGEKRLHTNMRTDKPNQMPIQRQIYRDDDSSFGKPYRRKAAIARVKEQFEREPRRAFTEQHRTLVEQLVGSESRFRVGEVVKYLRRSSLPSLPELEAEKASPKPLPEKLKGRVSPELQKVYPLWLDEMMPGGTPEQLDRFMGLVMQQGDDPLSYLQRILTTFSERKEKERTILEKKKGIDKEQESAGKQVKDFLEEYPKKAKKVSEAEKAVFKEAIKKKAYKNIEVLDQRAFAERDRKKTKQLFEETRSKKDTPEVEEKILLMSTAIVSSKFAFHDPTTGTICLRLGESDFHIAIHETIHGLGGDAIGKVLGHEIMEGATEELARDAIKQMGIPKSGDYYPFQRWVLEGIMKLFGWWAVEDVRRIYLSKDVSAIQAKVKEHHLEEVVGQLIKATEAGRVYTIWQTHVMWEQSAQLLKGAEELEAISYDFGMPS